MRSTFKKHRTEAHLEDYVYFGEQSKSRVLAILHCLLFKIFTIQEVAGEDLFPKSDKIEYLIGQYRDQWPYKFPEVLRYDYVKKIQTAFKKKYVGDENK